MQRETTIAAPVSFSGWILIMSLGLDGPGLSQLVIGLKTKGPDPAWDVQERRTFQPRCGFGLGPIRKENLKRFYHQPHRFYGGIDLPARTMFLKRIDLTGITILQG